MRGRIPAILLLLTVVACMDQGPVPPHTAISNSKKASRIKAVPVVTTISNLSAPESALYDPEQDVYFISNMNGGLLERDNNGFISRVDAQTLKVDLKWIEAGKNGVALDAPKGMAIAGNTLYVSDIGCVRMFDRKSGAVLGAIQIPGTTLVNDLATDGTNVYVSDTGALPAAGETLAPTGTDSIWKISNGKAVRIAASRELKQPNGLAWSDGKLYVATFGGNEIYQLDGDKKTAVVNVPREQLDGLIVLGDGTMYVTSWYGTAVYRGKNGNFEPILQSIPTPADLGYDTKRHRLLVPATSLNHVTIHAVN